MSDQFSRSSGGLHCRAFFQRLHKHKRPRNVAFRLLNELHLNAIALRLENNNSFARRDLNSNYVIINLMGVDLRLFWMTDSIFQSFRGGFRRVWVFLVAARHGRHCECASKLPSFQPQRSHIYSRTVANSHHFHSRSHIYSMNI